MFILFAVISLVSVAISNFCLKTFQNITKDEWLKLCEKKEGVAELDLKKDTIKDTEKNTEIETIIETVKNTEIETVIETVKNTVIDTIINSKKVPKNTQEINLSKEELRKLRLTFYEGI